MSPMPLKRKRVEGKQHYDIKLSKAIIKAASLKDTWSRSIASSNSDLKIR
jgi:hypothetical protein